MDGFSDFTRVLDWISMVLMDLGCYFEGFFRGQA